MSTYTDLLPIRALVLFAARLASDEQEYDLPTLNATATIEALQSHPEVGTYPWNVRKVHVHDASAWDAPNGIFVLHFGAYGWTHVLAFGHLEHALEDAASVLAEVAPGLFHEPEYPARTDDMSDDDYYDACEEAEVDLTRTEAGFIASWEWSCTEFESLEDVVKWSCGE
jgi:hypothetical protein